MAEPEITQNKVPQDVELKDLLDLHKRDIMLGLNCHAIGIVQNFDPSRQTVDVLIAYQKTIFKPKSPNSQTYVPSLVNYPPITDCPVIFVGGAGGALTYPIENGDTCLLLFNDRSIDKWFAGAKSGGVSSPRLHSFSDPVALVGLRSLADVLEDFDNTRITLRNKSGDTGVGVKDGKVKVFNDTTTLNTLLQDLITQIKAITTTNAVPGNPCLISPASQLALTNVATQIAGLLE